MAIFIRFMKILGFFLLLENGGRLLTEDGSSIVLEGD
tara:strand:- start:1037 stop:1147 length:111 start_codon:yes stop_codon:yes gene_type:complete